MQGFELVHNRERPKNNLERLKNLVGEISASINKEAERDYGIKNLVNNDGSLRMESYAKPQGGIYEQEQIEEDKEMDYGSEVSNAVAHSLPYKSPEQRAAIDIWKQDREKSRAHHIELAIMALFHRVLGEEYVVVRSATHDDYNSGVDMLVVNKRTGDILCAIDEVHTDDSEIAGRDPFRGKGEKYKKKALRGGARLDYGLTMQSGKLKRSKLQNLPLLYAGLTTNEFIQLTSAMQPGMRAELTDLERSLFLRMVDSMQKQINELKALHLQQGIERNINSLNSTIEKLRHVASMKDRKLPLAA